MAKSVGHLHLLLSATAAQFTQEFDRADNVARRKSAAIRASVSKMVKDVQRDFSLPKLGKGLLTGLGIGGGMQLMSTGIDKFVEFWRMGTSHAKEMAEHVSRIRSELRDLHDKRFDVFLQGAKPGEKPEIIDREIVNKERHRAQAQEELDNANEAVRFAGMNAITEWAKGKFGDVTAGAVLKKAAEEAEKQIKALEAFDDEIRDLRSRRKKAGEDVPKAVDDALEKFFKPLDQLSEQMNKRLEAAGDRMREQLRTPMEKLWDSVAEAIELRDRGFIDGETERRALKAAGRDFDKATDPLGTPEFRRWEQAAGAVRVDEMTRRGMGVGANYSEINKDVRNILAEIAQLMRQALMRGLAPQFPS